MKKWILLLPIILILGCAPNETVVSVPQEPEINIEEIKKQLKKEIKEELKEEIKEELIQEEAAKEPELTLETYDYKVDPDTVIVQINEDNIEEYVSLVVFERTYRDEKDSAPFYCVQTHSKMYDEGYVCVGYENSFVVFDKGFYGNSGKLDENALATGCLFGNELCWKLPSKEKAEDYANKGITFFEPNFDSQNATYYFQKIEDVKFGYEITEDGLRVLNGNELHLNPNNPY